MNKRKFTWLDGLICGVLVIAIAVGAFLLFGRKDGGEPQNLKTYELTMRFNRATTVEYDYYKVGDTLYFQNRTDVLGTVTSLEEIDKVHEEYDEDNGRYVTVVDPEQKTVVMKVRVQGSLAGGRFTVGGEQMNIGKVFYPQSDTTRSIMTLWDIKEVQE